METRRKPKEKASTNQKKTPSSSSYYTAYYPSKNNIIRHTCNAIFTTTYKKVSMKIKIANRPPEVVTFFFFFFFAQGERQPVLVGTLQPGVGTTR